MTAVAAAWKGTHVKLCKPPVTSYARRNVSQLPASAANHSYSQSPQNSWQSADSSRHSLLRISQSAAGDNRAARAAKTASYPSSRHGPTGTVASPPSRSSSAVLYRESAFDVGFPTGRVSPCRQEPARTATEGPSSPPRSEPIRYQARGGSSASPRSPKSSLVQKISNVLRRRAKSPTNNREPSLNEHGRVTDITDGKGFKKAKAWKPKWANPTLPFIGRQEEILLEQFQTGKGNSYADHYVESSPPASPTWSTEADSGSEGSEDRAASDEYRDRPCVKLPTTPVNGAASQFQTVVDTPTKSNTLDRRHQQLRIQLNATELAIVAKRYLGPPAAEHAVADVSQLMTSLCHVTTPTSGGSDDTSASDNLARGSGSKKTTDSGCDKLDVVDGGRQPPLVDSSFVRTELMPTVRRFINICQQLSAAATTAERAEEFSGLLTDSVHAFISVLAVSRRATYGQWEWSQLSDALGQVARSFCDMVTAAGSSLGLAADDPTTILALSKAARLAQRLSSLLESIKQLKAKHTDF